MNIKEFGLTIMTLGAAIITLLTFVLTVWWLGVVRSLIDKQPLIVDGVVVLDQFQRAKDILLVVFPLFSAAVAYWIGSKEASEAKADRNAAERRLRAVIAVAPPGTLTDAQQRDPEAFK